MYTKVSDEATREALRRLGEALGQLLYQVGLHGLPGFLMLFELGLWWVQWDSNPQPMVSKTGRDLRVISPLR
ncbi:hypothetical protein LO763_11330 [Glycomyces sp. A-F 0318]|nr:hypothetical protein [Glycomyces amatae]MCD0444214.1 hypothetical protein [Glycomyces amatae]